METPKSKTFQVVAGFEMPEVQDPKATHAVRMYPQVPLLLRGLLICGKFSPHAEIVDLRVAQNCTSVNAAGIPAAYFTTGRSFEQLQKMAELGELPPQPHQLLGPIKVDVGAAVEAIWRGEIERLAVWGVMRADAWGGVRVDVSRNDPEKVTGRIFFDELDGEREVFCCVAPTEQAVVELVNQHLSRRVHYR